jgi:hypothetical protein
MSQSFVCRICGNTHDGAPKDIGYTLPDEVWAIPEEERRDRARFTADLCEYADRYFIRSLLRVPLTGDDYFGWGVWVEVDRSIFARYVSLFAADGSAEPRYNGKLANDLPGYGGTLGANIIIQFGDRTSRPSVYLLPDDQSLLAIEQRHGMTESRYHEILSAR